MDELDNALKGYREAIRVCIDPNCRILGGLEKAVAASDLLIGDTTNESEISQADTPEQTESLDIPIGQVLETGSASKEPNPEVPRDISGASNSRPTPASKGPSNKRQPTREKKRSGPQKQAPVMAKPVLSPKPRPTPAEERQVEEADYRSPFFNISTRGVVMAVVVWILLILAIKYNDEAVALVVNALMYWLA